MHKCPRCKTEFGGKFCPECGYEWTEEKICPQCGTKTLGSTRFCEECGYSFAQESDGVYSWVSPERKKPTTTVEMQSMQTPRQKIKTEDRPSTFYSIIKHVPTLLLMVFSILMLIFFSVNVATMPATTAMGVAIPSQAYGSIYGDLLENLPEIKGVVIALIIFTSLTLAYTLLCVIISILHKTKNYRVLFLGKYDILLSEMFTILSPIIYALFIVLSSVLIGKLSSLDGGSGLIEIGTYGKLVLAFSIVFFVVSLCVSILRMVKYEVFLTQGGSMSAERKAELAEFYETHESPVAPRNVDNPIADKENGVGTDYDEKALAYAKYRKDAETYKFDKHRYDNGKEGKTAAGVIWLSLNKIKITVLAALVAIIIILLSTLIPYFANIFRAGKVEDIKLGMSQESVLDILGEPYDKKDLNKSVSDGILSDGGSGIIDSIAGSGTDGNNLAVVRWRYYDKEYAKARKEAEAQLDALGLKGGIDAVISDGLGGLTGVASSMTTVLTPLLSKVYDYIQVDFDENGCVVKVLLEKSRCDAVDKKTRSVSKMSFMDYSDGYSLNGDSNFYYFEENIGEKKTTIVTKDAQAWYTAYFDGGSFIRGYVDDFQFKDFDGSNKVVAKWKDDYAEYSATREAKRLGYVNSNSEWINEYSFESVDYLPDTVKVIGKNTFKDSKIQNIVIPNSVLTIDDYAFSGCTDLSKVEMGNKVESIGKNAFLNCKNLRYIDIPDSVKTIGECAFKGCESTKNNSEEYDNILTICCEASIKPSGWDEKWNESDYTVFWRCTVQDGIKYSFRYGSTGSEAVVIIQDKDIQTIAIPSVVYGWALGSSYKVVEISERAFYNCDKLTNVTMPDSVTSIADCAFYGCKNLTSIEISSSIEEIGKNAFKNCSSLQFNEYDNGLYLGNKDNPFVVCVELKDKNVTSLKLNDKTILIADGTFSDCDKLERIEISEGIKDLPASLFNDCKKLETIVVNEVNSKYSSQSGILYNKEKTEIIYVPKSLSGKIIIPNGITNIGDDAFKNCVGLTDIELPDSMLTIGDRAFSGCSGLSSIGMPESVISIGEQAFQDCNRLNYIVIPNSVTNIESYAFGRNSNTTLFCEVESKPMGWNDSWSINNHIVWGCSKDHNYAVIDNVCYALKDNEATVISQNPNINKIVIPEHITYNNRMYLIINIEEGALNGCSSITSIMLPFVGSKATADYASSNTLFGYIFGTSDYMGGIKTIQWDGNFSSTYYIPASLRSVTVTGGSVLYGAFSNCSSLTRIEIPNSVTSIGGRAFSNCSSLTSIEIPNNVTSIGYGAFEGCYSLTSIEIPNSVTSIGGCAFYNCSSLTSIEIPNSVTSIGGQAFGSCGSLKDVYYKGNIESWCSITRGSGTQFFDSGYKFYIKKELITELIIPDTVIEIKDYAFDRCGSLISVTISNSVVSIGIGAFTNCSNLRSIVVDSSNSCFSGQDGILYSKDKTKMIQVPRAISGGVTIPDNITRIGDRAFYRCDSLESIVIPNSVTSIGEEAFYNCSSLTSIKFNGTKAQWEAISKVSNWNRNTGNYTVTCTDGTLSKSES